MNKNKIEEGPRWMAVYAVSLGVAGLITSEFLPISILSPIAKDLHVTEGAAGQAISVTALIAMFSSILIGILTRKIDRRWVVLSFSVLQVASNLMVAFAPNYILLMVGRVLLGIGVGGFWAMSISIIMRLVPETLVPKALSIVFSAVSIATVLSGPLGSFLDGLIGWRNVFLLVAIVGGSAFVWQLFTLPSMPPTTPPGLKSLSDLLRRKPVRMGLLAVMFSFAGYAIFFTYLRPFLENVAHISSVNTLSFVLLVYGLANLIGAIAAKYLLQTSLLKTLTLIPFAMAVFTVSLIFIGSQLAFAVVLIALWGFAFGSIQVGWPTWLTRAAGDESESGGSLLVAFTQIAITLGAGLGGLVYDQTGIGITFGLGGVVLLMASVSAFMALKGIPLNSASKNQGKLHL
jgi:predicted MFS family arabinose efflux permease